MTSTQGTAPVVWVSKLLPAHTRVGTRHCVAEDTSVQNESNASTERNAVSPIASRISPGFATVASYHCTADKQLLSFSLPSPLR